MLLHIFVNSLESKIGEKNQDIALLNFVSLCFNNT